MNIPPQIDIPSGTILTLAAGTWQYGEDTLRLRVHRVMTEISRYEPGKVWIEGTRLDNERGNHWLQILVRIDALPSKST